MSIPVHTLLSCLSNVKGSGPWTAKCPTHDDQRNSLSITAARNGHAVLYCHANCKYDDIIAKIGLGSSDRSAAGGRAVVAEYSYTDINGTLLYQNVRYDPKDFRMRVPDGKGGWLWSAKGIRRLPYNLPALREAGGAGKTVFVAEGEKDVDSLKPYGITATTLAGGAATSIPDDFASYFVGVKSVVLLPDNDDPGRKFMQRVAGHLCAAGIECRTLELPGLKPKEDITDWLSRGGKVEELKALVRAAPIHSLSADEASSGYPSKRSRERPRTLGEWTSNPKLLQPLTPIIPSLVYPGRSSILAAREKTGKSTLIAQAVSALVTGEKFLGFTPSQAPVLWYCLDEPIMDCVQRFRTMRANETRLLISIEQPTAEQMIEEAIACKAVLVVVDTLSELWRGKIKNENDAGEVGEFLHPYVHGMRSINCALMLSHHTPKSGGGYRGSGAIGASVDVILDMRRPATVSQSNTPSAVEDSNIDDGCRVLEGRGRGVPHFVHRLSFDGQHYSLGEAPLPLENQILAILAEGGVGTRKIRDRLHVKAQRVTDTISGLESQGLICRDGNSWRLVAPGSQLHEIGDAETTISSGIDRSGTQEEPERNHSGNTVETNSQHAVPGTNDGISAREPLDPDETELLGERNVA